ncbi:MAG TPA: gamma-glutamyl-gamma-aminobutyrate hydrolase family protein [Candidatus Acidoferrales bacterium]|nr:gamma-glutamyl-gamma-aminobutyrate hydrolase family protein [Candidatus Acidoferrales bacterium]
MNPSKRAKPPLIGVTADVNEPAGAPLFTEPTLSVARRYTDALIRFGAVPLVVPPGIPQTALERLWQDLDGLLVTGGSFDIHPRHYGEEPGPALGEIKDGRTQFELELIACALQRDRPVLGICGGEQAINVALGGSLYQDIRASLPDALEHESAAGTSGAHPVRVAPATRLHAIVGEDALTVNTRHHQAVKQLGRGLVASAISPDGVIEGIESENFRFLLGVQWHPELLIARDAAQRKIFAAFVAACAQKRR